MDTTLTRTRHLPRDHAEALRVRHQAAMRIMDDMPTIEDRWDLLIAVVWPDDPLLGHPSWTSSAIESS